MKGPHGVGSSLPVLAFCLVSVLAQGCGLVVDAIQAVKPAMADELDAICAKRRVHVGMAVEPFRPFVFPAIWTDEGPRVTGLDVELIREMAAALSRRCGAQAVTPVLHLVHYRDLFVELNEGKLDLFVSATSAYIPSPVRAGLAYSVPYFYDAGMTGITKKPEVAARVRDELAKRKHLADRLAASKAALAGLTIAVQEGRGSHFFAEQNLPKTRLVLCDSLPAAFESGDLGIDVILGSRAILEFMVARERKDWQVLRSETGEPLLFNQGHFVVVLAEESYRLRWLVNDLLFQLEQSGRLAEMRRRWVDEPYAFTRRAATEGLPFAAENISRHNDQGQCRPAVKP